MGRRKEAGGACAGVGYDTTLLGVTNLWLANWLRQDSVGARSKQSTCSSLSSNRTIVKPISDRCLGNWFVMPRESAYILDFIFDPEVN